MTRCPGCHELVSAAAVLCPHCGAPREQSHAHRWPPAVRRLVYAVFILAGGVGTVLVGWKMALPFLENLKPDPVRAALAHLPSVLTLTTYSQDGDALGQGSGFLSGAGGLALTNYHVLAGAHHAEVRLDDGRLFDILSIEAYDVTRDACVFRIGRDWEVRREPPPPDIPSLELRAEPPARVGERIATLGSPRGLANTVSDGLVSAWRAEDGQRLIQFTAPISHGSSGGPLFDARGRVVGMVVATRGDAQNLNFAIPAESLKPLLLQKGLGWTVEQMQTAAHAAAMSRVEEADRLLEANDADKALPLYQRANDLDPYLPAAMLGMVVCFGLQDEDERSAEWLARFQKMVPDEALQKEHLRAMQHRMRVAMWRRRSPGK